MGGGGGVIDKTFCSIIKYRFNLQNSLCLFSYDLKKIENAQFIPFCCIKRKNKIIF